MKQYLRSILLLCCLLGASPAFSQSVPDTVKTGIYITSIHDINFKDKEFTVNFWLWLKYRNPEFNFEEYLEIPGAKTMTKSFANVDTVNGEVYMLLKMQCVMKDTWQIDNFPFDKQTLRISLENSQYDSESLVFAADTAGRQYDPRFTLRGWNIDSLKVTSGIKEYETAFGDPGVDRPHTEYATFRVKMDISRDAMGLFWKMFLGMYVAFLIAYMCFFIHPDSIDSRFGLSVGALFAVIGNKYIIDSALPESTTFTLVDTLHGVTLLFILSVVTLTALTLKHIKRGDMAKAQKLDKRVGHVLVAVYVLLNAFFIWQAV